MSDERNGISPYEILGNLDALVFIIALSNPSALYSVKQVREKFIAYSGIEEHEAWDKAKQSAEPRDKGKK